VPPDTSASPCHCRGITMDRRLQLRLDIERYRKVSACAQQRGTSVAAVIGRPLTAVSVVPTTGAQPRAVAFWTRSRCRSRMYGGCWRSSTLYGVAGRDRARPDGAGVRDRPRGALPIAARRGSRTLHPRRGLDRGGSPADGVGGLGVLSPRGPRSWCSQRPRHAAEADTRGTTIAVAPPAARPVCCGDGVVTPSPVAGRDRGRREPADRVGAAAKPGCRRRTTR
jgi:hypothetical protein